MEPPPSNISAFLLATIHLTIIQLRHRAGQASEEVTPGVVLPSAIAVIGRDSGVLGRRKLASGVG